MKKISVAVLITMMFSSLPSIANNTLPDIGTSASTTLSVAQENEMGDFYIRAIRGSTPLINDPVLNVYINSLGNSLAKYADGGNQIFNFHLVNNDEINAYAFFGGHVVFHSGLFREVTDENELASVVAHEIAHITQRHLARAMEAQKKQSPLTWAGVLGGALLTMANPNAGMAAVTGSLASSQQSAISFTQSNEREADNIGLNIMQRAGFDARGMNNFMQKMADNARHSSKPPQMLLTHPLPDSRLADARSRTYQLTEKARPSSMDFYFAKAKVLALYGNKNGNNTFAFDALLKGNQYSINAHTYGSALKQMEKRQYAKAFELLSPLYESMPDNIWLIDAMTDIDLGQGQATRAITRLEVALTKPLFKNNPVIEINLANSYISVGQFAKANRLLFNITRRNPNDVNAWYLLAESAAKLGDRAQELSARAESYALGANIEGAIGLLKQAVTYTDNNQEKAKLNARLKQFEALKLRFENYR
ncbi:M48 family metalloprotease [Thorsellia anophelis]|uniref:Beta-barrel assembly-enhancing protease n=1 Tax=Thorsellia anophelis DSM 18579 TaxID=1123402 RepID=A0A1I0EIN6_9GAMM|nr:M48 family metalloprotease [Thorsellia anophelis]SET44825.1 Putative Zn-dependent protease, contains TPR repeats [Thorsellia anophelis DSM 18579]